MIRNIVIGAAGLVAIILVAPQILPAPSTPGRIAAPTGPSQGEPTPAARPDQRYEAYVASPATPASPPVPPRPPVSAEHRIYQMIRFAEWQAKLGPARMRQIRQAADDGTPSQEGYNRYVDMVEMAAKQTP
jgi:type IV secretory pathway VirB10-like protein